MCKKYGETWGVLDVFDGKTFCSWLAEVDWEKNALKTQKHQIQNTGFLYTLPPFTVDFPIKTLKTSISFGDFPLPCLITPEGNLSQAVVLLKLHPRKMEIAPASPPCPGCEGARNATEGTTLQLWKSLPTAEGRSPQCWSFSTKSVGASSEGTLDWILAVPEGKFGWTDLGTVEDTATRGSFLLEPSHIHMR